MFSLFRSCVFVILYILYLNISYSETAKALDHGKVVVCYLTNWSVYRPGKGAFTVEHVDPSLCTNLVYSFARLDFENNSIKTIDPWQDLPDNYGKDGYARAVKLKEKNSKLKVTIALGGWDDGSTNYSIIAADPIRRKQLVTNALQFVKKYKFDGLDLHWKYPTERGGKPEDKQNFVLLVKEFRQAFTPNNLLLTAAFGANTYTLNRAYDVAELSKHLDYVHIMCYDYHGSWDRKFGINAPLRSHDELNTEFSVNYLLDKGMDPSKLILGLPFYGQTYYLEDDKVTTDSEIIGAPTKEIGFEGPFTKQNNFLGYNEICLELQKPRWKKLWDEESFTPYALNEDKVISYDNEESMREKIKFAMQKKLAGAMVWSIDMDDFRGDCNRSGGQKFSLMHAINNAIVEALQNGVQTPVATSEEVHTTHNKNKYPLIPKYAFLYRTTRKM